MIESAEEFYRLRTSDHPEEYNRSANEAASMDVWLQVIERYPDMREWVAHNKTVPVEILRLLSTDPDLKVRCTVARKRKLPGDLQIVLARDPDVSVRCQLMWNAKVTREVLEILAHDSDPYVRKRLRERLSSRPVDPPIPLDDIGEFGG